MWNGFKKWEMALAAGLMIALLAAPVEGRQIPLSRWSLPRQERQIRYQVSLFPFAVGEGTEETSLTEKQEQVPEEYEVRFWIRNWWEQIRRARDS